MMQLRELRLTGPSVPDASVRFDRGANVFSGVSDTGKSYMFHCIDFILGATKMDHKIDEANGYEYVLLELANTAGATLSLKRALAGGKISAYNLPLDQIRGAGKVVLPKRNPKSTADDLTSVVLPFAGMRDVELRKNVKGHTQRLTIRTLIPIFLVDEDAIFSIASPVIGVTSFDNTPRKRMLSYMLTGNGDKKPAAEPDDVIQRAKARAKVELLVELLRPIEDKEAGGGDDSTIESVDDTIAELTSEMQGYRAIQDRLKIERAEAIKGQQFAEGQIIAIDEMLTRYELLDERYGSDLDRLDFVAEGSHFFDSLQQERCPLCDQPMSAEHHHAFAVNVSAPMIQVAAKAEASKILGLRSDLGGTTATLKELRATRDGERVEFKGSVDRLGRELDEQIVPALVNVKERLEALIRRRGNVQARDIAREQAVELRALNEKYSQEANPPANAPVNWEGIDEKALLSLCIEIEGVLKEWGWSGPGRVTFDDQVFDISVDGKPRRSHGQGVRAVLHAAFAVGLLRYCIANKTPHPGFVLLDSPLTTFKQSRDDATARPDAAVDKSIEGAFWRSLSGLANKSQIIVFDNKEPPADVTRGLKYEFFAGPDAGPTERRGFIPQ
ncbi:hypothetical protein [Roseococcus sp.]|uniref:hypothetical protein n=1 Tax=Roseococcus sp. TaxID=2109646 RepID=UPI003BA8569C